MTSETSVTQENANYNEFLKEKIKVTNSVNIFCKYLLDNALNNGRYFYPSLNSLKFDDHLCLSFRTIDRLVHSLVEKSILIKLPRTKSQPYQIDLNNSLFRLVLAIYHPSLPNSFDNKLKKTEMKRLEELQCGKKDLHEIKNRLEFEGDYFFELHERLMGELAENASLAKTSDYDLKMSLRSIICEYSYNKAVDKFPILNDFLLEDEKD